MLPRYTPRPENKSAGAGEAGSALPTAATFCVAFLPEAGRSLIVFWAVTPTCGKTRSLTDGLSGTGSPAQGGGSGRGPALQPRSRGPKREACPAPAPPGGPSRRREPPSGFSPAPPPSRGAAGRLPPHPPTASPRGPRPPSARPSRRLPGRPPPPRGGTWRQPGPTCR